MPNVSFDTEDARTSPGAVIQKTTDMNTGTAPNLIKKSVSALTEKHLTPDYVQYLEHSLVGFMLIHSGKARLLWHN